MLNYTDQINSIQTPTFQQIRKIADESISHCSKQKRDELWKQLNHGKKLLDSHKLLCQYLWSFGNMHEAKMKTALQSIVPQQIFNDDFAIVDWGCGQGLATVCFFDYLNEKNISNKTKKVILIEPSKMALDRAKLHVNTYLKDENKIESVNKLLDDVTQNDIKTDTFVTLHFFSNILDIKDIDLKTLAKNVSKDVSGEHYFFCVGPLNYGNNRIDAFYDYFLNPPTLADTEKSENTLTLLSDDQHDKDAIRKYTLKLKIFKFESNRTYYIPIEYYPPVQFHAGYQLDCVKQVVKTFSQEDKQRYISATAFEVSAPFDIGASIYDDVNPIFAVLNNIIIRGAPTRTSPFIEQVFEKFGNQKAQNDLGNIMFGNDNLETDNLLSSVEYLLPIAVARVQKTILEALMTDKISIDKSKWHVLVTERDVPCSAIAFEDLRQMFDHLTVLSKEYQDMKFPKINLEIISTKEFADSPLHLDIKPTTEPTNQQRFKEYDMVIDISVLQKSDIKTVAFSEFKCKNNCYFNIRSAKQIRNNRHIYTSDTVEYRPLVTKDTQGNYKDIAETKEHLQYFLQLLFRKEDFRPGQLPILNRALQNKSVIGLLPTGGGKSLTYQLAAMLQPGVTLVIDPLKSLMKDQYDGLINAGIDTCVFINSTLTAQEKEEREKQMESSQMQFVFLSPERLCIYKFREQLKTMRDLHVYFAYGVIDEVHCVSEWGHDFRFSYLHLGRNLYNYVCTKNQENQEKHLTLFGLTATASFDVLADVERELSGNGAFSLDADTIVRYENTNRLELQYKIEKIDANVSPNNKWDIYKAKNEQITNNISQIPALIGDLQSPESIKYIKNKFIERENLDKKANKTEIDNIINTDLTTKLPDDWLKQQNKSYKQGGIIFCPHRQGSLGIDSIQANRGIASAIKDDLNCNVGAFKGGDEMTDQDRFINNELPLMVATKAFGMGIDKPNVRFTVNINMCSSLESFIQEAGRAGRDRRMALAIILYSDLGDVDKNVMMYFYNNTFKGAEHEKQVMHNLLSLRPVDYFIAEDEMIEKQPEYSVAVFLTTLLNTQINQSIVAFVSYQENDDTQYDYKDYVHKAIYRMCCIELIDDFTQDYNNHQFRIVSKRKADGEYYQGLKRFLMRYYSTDRSEEEIRKVPDYKGENEIHKCLGYLTEFIYEKIAIKRKRAIDDMQTFCIQGLDDTKDWKEVNEDLKDFIYYYFNSKYAKDDYVADNSEEFSLTQDTDRGRISSIDIVSKYIRVVDDDLIDAGGTPKDNVKHLQGAVRLIRRSLTETNSALDLLNAFCLFYLGTNNNQTLDEELQRSYKDGLIGFSETVSNYEDFWNFFEDFHTGIKEKAREIEKLNDIKEEITASIHAKIIRSLTNKYIEQ